MAKDSGRFDMEDVGWKKPCQEDPLSRVLLRASREVQNGAIWGFFVGLALGLAAVALALTVHKAFWLATFGSLMLGLLGGAITGKLIELRRAWRRRGRRAKLDDEEKERKKKGRREAQDDDYRG